MRCWNSVTADVAHAWFRNVPRLECVDVCADAEHLSKLPANDRTHSVTIAVKRGIIDVQPPLGRQCCRRSRRCATRHGTTAWYRAEIVDRARLRPRHFHLL